MKRFLTTLALTATLAAAALPAIAQDYGAMIRQSMARQQAIVDAATQRANGAVQQRMQDPQVLGAYRQYAWNMQQRGQAPMNFQQFTYQWIYTNGFSAAGIRHAQQNEAGIAQREAASVQALRQAEWQRGQAQQAQRDGYFRNQQEAGRGLMGQSSYALPNGATTALPHTWAANTTQQYQGNTYHVDASGQYHVLAANGWWYPVTPQR
ncbi:MAG: hypothetical protein ABW220_02740 [Burkholderiaceae bacterium]